MSAPEEYSIAQTPITGHAFSADRQGEPGSSLVIVDGQLT